MNKKILVTGGAGFLGSHLCDRLIAEGDTVICVDNLFTGSKKNIEDLLEHPRFTFIEHDIIDPLFIDEHIEEIYNLACPASPVHYQYNPIRTVKANTIGVINMLGLAKKHGAKILQASTSEIYGDPEIHPQVEAYRGNVSTIGPRACYDEGKRCAETLFFDYHRQHGLQIKVARIFNTYGTRMQPDDGRVMSNFIMQALADQDITVYGNGSQTRSFCYVSDLIDALVRLMNTPAEVTGPINLGNPAECTIRELAEKIIIMTNANASLKFEALPTDDPTRRRPDISLAIKTLDWQPKISLSVGLERTIAYFKNGGLQE
ncbi:MAG: NAD-dependent epimerase/dehydratase [Candidatus Magasanikbacteria bacterium GW2011_GWD2_43_18]|nr:MAG: NAD-dependent epimerase/dehydratase [Candidatus Magasanikbacteria bacterium GW2011_GWC2_42_27]KKT05252.1 MAG: NAD-dependent epimerase/dehydratase [Candidatus Magasanikbacteria bacterium GW2011_GWD2_43_18]KKT26126.1 MAG: NAD-dependent epimerase/dehydratase [Candidatus Magasanikbacteria bacterium GW2011_GWA2_43_9]